MGGLFVVGLNLTAEFDGLVENLAQLVGKVLGTTHHTVKEFGVVQLFVGYRLNLLLPFAGYIKDALTQVQEGFVVQLFQ